VLARELRPMRVRQRTSTLPVRVYTYGCRAPTRNGELVDQQIVLARRYRNTLLEIVLERRMAYRECTARAAPQSETVDAIARCQAQLATLRKSIRAQRRAARSRSVAATESEEAARLYERLKALRDTAREERARVIEPTLKYELTTLDKETIEKQKRARAASGLYWGTYLLVEEAVERASKARVDPRFGRWDGSGAIGISLQGGADVEDILSGRSRFLQIRLDGNQRWSTRRERRAARGTVCIRVGSEGQKPIWAEFPVMIHRPLPSDGRVKAARVIRRREAHAFRYELHVVVEAASLARTAASQVAPAAAINLGWRSRPDGIRVAMLVDELGQTRELLVPRDLIARLDHASTLRSTRHKNLDEFRPQLVAVLRELPEAPEWVRTALASIATWRTGRTYSFIRRWASARFANDEAAFRSAEEWRKQELHLLQWETHERAGALRQRRELYRLFAVELSRTYSTVVLEKYDLSKFARVNKTEAAYRHQRNRIYAAPSLLRRIIAHRTSVSFVPPDNNSDRCHLCGSLEAFDAAKELVHVCGGCGVGWDQDENNAHNALRRWHEQKVASDDCAGELVLQR
jgi:hypothetical protein